MTVMEFYQQLGTDGDYTLRRFSGNLDLLTRFILRFPTEPTFQSLSEAVTGEDYRQIETLAHTLKGITANLGLDILSEPSTRLVSAVRTQEYSAIPSIFQSLSDAHEKVVGLIAQIG